MFQDMLLSSQDTFEDLIINNIPLAEISNSSVHGLGLFATQFMPKAHVLAELSGQIISWNDYDKIVSHLKPQLGHAANYLFMEWNALDQATLLVRTMRTKYSYINHSRTPNAQILYDPIRVATQCDIKKGDEILIDYRKEPLCDDYLNGLGKGYL